MDYSYQEKLEKLVDEQETLIIAEQEALKILINFCEDRHSTIERSLSKVIDMYPLMLQFSKSFAFFNCDDEMTKEKLEAVPWEHLKHLAGKIPTKEELEKKMKEYQSFFSTHQEFKKLIDIINEKADSLSAISKEIVVNRKNI